MDKKKTNIKGDMNCFNAKGEIIESDKNVICKIELKNPEILLDKLNNQLENDFGFNYKEKNSLMITKNNEIMQILDKTLGKELKYFELLSEHLIKLRVSDKYDIFIKSHISVNDDYYSLNVNYNDKLIISYVIETSDIMFETYVKSLSLFFENIRLFNFHNLLDALTNN